MEKLRELKTQQVLNIKIPFIEHVQIFPKIILRWDGEPQRIPTGGEEKQLIWIDTTARWKIADINKFYTSIKTMDRAYIRIDAAIEPAVRGVIAKYPLLEMIRSSNDPIQRLSHGILTAQEAKNNTTYQITKGRKSLKMKSLKLQIKIQKILELKLLTFLLEKLAMTKLN